MGGALRAATGSGWRLGKTRIAARSAPPTVKNQEGKAERRPEDRKTKRTPTLAGGDGSTRASAMRSIEEKIMQSKVIYYPYASGIPYSPHSQKLSEVLDPVPAPALQISCRRASQKLCSRSYSTPIPGKVSFRRSLPVFFSPSHSRLPSPLTTGTGSKFRATPAGTIPLVKSVSGSGRRR